MAEPEELLIDAAHRATERSAALWRRVSPVSADPPGLAEVRGRLAFFLEAICPDAPVLAIADAPATPTWIGQFARREPRHLIDRRAMASTDGVTVRLPAHLDVETMRVPAAYRVLALGQTLRARRGSARALPAGVTRLVRDLYAVAEASVVERELVALAPGLLRALCSLRGVELGARPSLDVLTPPEQAVEGWVRAVLAAAPEEPPATLPRSPTPEESLEWAQATALSVLASGERYRGVAAVALWGRLDRIEPMARAIEKPLRDSGFEPPPRERTHLLKRRPRVRGASEGEDDRGQGIWMAPTSDRQESVEDPMGLVRPSDRDDAADPGGLADALSELPEARLVTTPGAPREVLESGDPPGQRAVQQPARTLASSGVAYPEWNWRTASYVPERAIVQLVTAPEGSQAWVDETLRYHAPLIQRTRRRFERLRPRRARLRAQVDGDEIDLDAWVEAVADARSGGAASDRLYVSERPLRRDLAVLLLVDASASTDAWVDGRRRIIDVEKESLLVVCEGLSALGDRFAILAFSGEGPEAVRISTLKDFKAPLDSGVRRRIAGLEPDRFTRLGTAIRLATGVLAGERVPHPMLLVLSDGRPNDVDEYEGRYGVEDARKAVHEAWAEGVRPFCVTIDRHAGAYVSRVFGRAGYKVLRRVDALPNVLLDAVRQLVR